MPTANGSKPKFERKRLDPTTAKWLNDFQAHSLAGRSDASGVPACDSDDEEEDE